jgi:hypothetical protein
MGKVLILLVCLFMSGCCTSEIACVNGCGTVSRRCSGNSCIVEYTNCVAVCRGVCLPSSDGEESDKESDEELE